MEKEPKNSEQGSEKFGEDLQEELRFFLENRLDGLLDEAEKFRQTKQSYRKTRSKFLRHESNPEKNQGFLPFLYSISNQREGNREEPESKVSGDES